MAEERNVGLARAAEPQNDDDATKVELQRRMDEARESITQTVSEIKDTVTNQYQQVRETINDSLDWREQFRRRPVAFSASALGLGFLLGYGVGGAFAGDSDERDYYVDDDDFDDDDFDTDRVAGGVLPSESRSYAAQAIAGNPYSSSSHESGPAAATYRSGAPSGPVAPMPMTASRPSYSSGYESTSSDMEEPEKPGVYERFKGTKAFDRLQSELSTLGDRFVEELSGTARNVVLPALLGRVKDMIGIDLSTQREVATRSKLEHQSSDARAGAEAASESQPTQRSDGRRSGSSASTSP